MIDKRTTINCAILSVSDKVLYTLSDQCWAAALVGFKTDCAVLMKQAKTSSREENNRITMNKIYSEEDVLFLRYKIQNFARYYSITAR